MLAFAVLLLSSNIILATSWESPMAYENKTILVPSGSSTYDNGKVLCFPITILEILLFFALNFITHVVTVVSAPGETTLVNVSNMVLALFFPTSGLMRGLNTIVRRVALGTSDLDRACRAGALCGVVRNNSWRPPSNTVLTVVVEEDFEDEPENHDIEDGAQASQEAVIAVYGPTWLKEDHTWWIYFDTLWSRSVLNEYYSKIHGAYRLPPGYSFAILPSTSVVVSRLATTGSGFKHTSKIASSHSKAKIVASIVQLLYAAVQLFLRSGDQFARYGYASPYFAVVPYAIMSLVNGIAHLITPEYSSVFMVDSPCMTEARQAGGEFEGVVGRVIPTNSPGDAGFAKRKLDQFTSIDSNPVISFWNFLGSLQYPWLAFHLLYDQPCKQYLQRVRIIIELAHAENDQEINPSDKASSEFELEEFHSSSGSLFDSDTLFSSGLSIQEQNFENQRRRVSTINNPGESEMNRREAEELRVLHSEKCYRVSPAPTEDDLSLFNAIFHGSKLGILEWMKYPSALMPMNLLGAIYWLSEWMYNFNAYNYNAFFYATTNLVELYKIIRRLTILDFKGLIREEFLKLVSPPQKRTHKPAKLCIPSCPRFLRKDDPEYLHHIGHFPADSGSTLFSLHVLTTQVCLAPLSCTNMIQAKPRPEKPITTTATAIQTALGTLISSLAFVPIGYYTHFLPESSTTMQQVIMMLWLGIGICVGLIMPFFSVTDLLFLLFMPPYYGMLSHMNYLGMMPFGIFVPPILGLVEVWLMLSEHCVGLY